MLRFGTVVVVAVLGCSAATATPPPAGDAGGSDSSVVSDAAVEDGGARPCKANFECTSPGAKVCDTAAGKCVQCTKANDTACPATEHCDATTNTCVAGCKNDQGCKADGDAGTDGAVAARRCDTAANTCVECLADVDCPAGSLCAGKVCSAGCSETKACPVGQTCCTGACVDTKSNVDHCGACSAKCSIMGATAKCEAGACAIASCDGLRGDCDKNPTNACETDLSSSTSNCGSCGTRCPFVVNGLPACTAGKCSAACDTGFGDCDSTLANGCETNLNNNLSNCGACGMACTTTITNGTPVCSAGKCAAICSAGYGDCDKNLSTGCETSIASDPKNCGACGVECAALPNATATCGVGACVISSCNVNYGNCDGTVSNGCEANLLTDASHCGACGRPCTIANGTGACTTGACRVASCTGTFSDCNGLPTDGCEVNTATDRNNCGGCGTACPSGQSCVAGTCSLVVGVTYSQSFPTGTVSAASAQCSAWNTFRGAIQTTAYSKITIRGSRDTVGVSCTGTVANTLCQSLRIGTVMSTSVACGGRNWKTGTCATGFELSANGDTCQCTTGYIVRPCIGNSNWGGINGTTCGATAQTMEVVCE